MSTHDKKMKILITTDLYTVSTNGVVTSVKNLFDELTKLGHDVRILTISDTYHSHKDGAVYYIRSIPLKIVYPDLRMPTSFRHKLIQEIIDWKPDVIHSQCEFFSYQFAARIAKITDAPLVHTYHTLYEQYLTSYVIPSKRLGEYLTKVLSRQRLRKVDTLVAPTPKVEQVLQTYGIGSPINVVPSGISLSQHSQRLTAEDRSSRRHALGIADDEQVILNLGRLGGEKNLSELLTLFSDALAQNGKMKFLIVGDGPDRENLENQAKNIGIAQKVIFTGMVPPDQVQYYYQLGDVFVSASTSETQGLTYVEAAANGLPLLCRQDDCLTQILQSGENGYAYTNAEEFLQAIDLMMDTGWRSAAAKRSEELAASFDKEAFGEAIEKIYDAVLQPTK